MSVENLQTAVNMKVPVQKILCTLCKEKFSTQPELRQHMTNIHGKVMHECLQCGKEFCRASELRKHAVRHTGQHVCSYCSNTFSSSHALKVHIMTHTGEKPHACSQCDKKFAQAVQLKQHMMNHHGGEKPYKCSYCSKGYCTPSDLNIHETTHTGEKLFSCSHCGKGFRYSPGLKVHIKKFHDGAYTNILPGPSTPTTPVTVKVETLHRCSYCMEAFSDQEDLRTHMLSHSVGKKHICSYCYKGFSQSSQLKVHIMTHTGEKPQGCSHCDKRFVQISSLQAHMQTYHGVEKPYKCSYCSKSFRAPSYLKDHEVTHTGKKLHKCSHCSKSFNRYTSLKMHMKTYMTKKTHSCSDCNKKFPKLSQLKKHSSKYHNEKQDPESIISPSHADAPTTSDAHIVESGEKPHRCCHCGKRFGKLTALQTHLMIHTGEKPFTCSYCFKAFRTAYNLKIHIMSHTGEKPHKCSQCDKAFIHGWGLKSHMLAVHGENNPFKCSYCPKEFSTLTESRTHETAHKNETPWTCSYCSKRFRFPSTLRQHMETHTKVKPQGDSPLNLGGQVKDCRGRKSHKCLYCSQVFRKYSTLELHLTSHTGEIIYVCSLCNKSFPNMSALQQHTDEHELNKPTSEEHKSTDSIVSLTTTEMPIPHTQEKPYTCSHCDRGFRYRTDLKRHKLIHTGERPHICQYCPKAFKTSSHLKFHTMIHTGEKPQKCSHCDKRFVQTSSLRWHLRSKHKAETNSLNTSTCGVETADSSLSQKQEDTCSQDDGKSSLFETYNDHVSQKANKTLQKQCGLSVEASPSTNKIPEKPCKSLKNGETSDEPSPSSKNIKREPYDKPSPCSDKTMQMSCQSSKPCDTLNEIFPNTQKIRQQVRTSPRRKASAKLDEIIQKLCKKSKHAKTLINGSPSPKKSVPVVPNSSKHHMMSNQTSPDPNKFAQKLCRSSKCETSDKVSLHKISQKLRRKSKLCDTSNEASPNQPILSQNKDLQKLAKYYETTSEDKGSKSPNNITMPDLASPNRITQKRKLPIRFRDEVSCNQNSPNLDKMTIVVFESLDTPKAVSEQLSRSPKTNIRNMPNSSQNSVPISEEASTSLNKVTENVTEGSASCGTTSDEAYPKPNRASRKRKLPIRFRQEAAPHKIPLNRTKISQEEPIISNYCDTMPEHGSPGSEKTTQITESSTVNEIRSDLDSTQRVHRMRKLPVRYREEMPSDQAPPKRITNKELMSPNNSVPCETSDEPCQKSKKSDQSCQKSKLTTTKCSVCSKTLSSLTTLMYHMRQHTGEKPHVCAYCGVGFARWCTLIIHRRIHTGETPYKCSVCKQGFSQLLSLQAHMTRHPFNKQRYSDCRKQVTSGRRLSSNDRIVQGRRKKHARVHDRREQHKKHTRKRKLPIRFRQETAPYKIPLNRTKISQEEPIISNYCDTMPEPGEPEHGSPGSKKITLEVTESSTVNEMMSDLASTQRVPRMRKLPVRYREEMPSDQAPPKRITNKELKSPNNSVPCETSDEPCEKSKKSDQSCQKSKMTTTKCAVCSKTLSSLTTLMYHMRQHTGEKPHVCAYCGVGFARWCTLIIHRRIHTGETPYKCSVCKQGFRQLPSLQAHMTRHPNKKQHYSVIRRQVATGCRLSSNDRVVQDRRKKHARVHDRRE